MSEQTEAIEKIELVLNHIKTVQRNCYRLGIKLIKNGDIELGRNLISNGQIHDNSKLKGIEFDHLFYGDPLLPEIVKHHQSINPHHPEYWGNIKEMPRVYIAEMVCDWYARSMEFGTNIRDWIDNVSLDRFSYDKNDKVYTEIMEFLNLLLNPSFS